MAAALSGRRLLACFPHPDDESYAAGGLLAWCAAHGGEARLLCATRGEAGFDRHRRLAPGLELAAVRSAELAAACAALGIGAPLFADLPDGGLATVDRTAALDSLAKQIEAFAPHVVVSLGRDGAYGHRDHLAWTALVEAAVRAQDRPPRLLHAAFARGHFAALHRLAARAGAIDADLTAEALGITEADVDWRLDVRPYAERKLAACAAHDSQFDCRPGSFFRRLLDPLLLEEWYVVAAGPPLPAGAVDPFAGL